jgi:hypothetical protein
MRNQYHFSHLNMGWPVPGTSLSIASKLGLDEAAALLLVLLVLMLPLLMLPLLMLLLLVMVVAMVPLASLAAPEVLVSAAPELPACST